MFLSVWTNLGRLSAARAICVVVVAGLAMAGCSSKALLERITKPEDRAAARQVIGWLQANDQADLIAEMPDALKPRLTPLLGQMNAVLPSGPGAVVTLEDASSALMTSPGAAPVRKTTLAYEVDQGERHVLVRVSLVRQDGRVVLTGLRLIPLAEPVEALTAFSLKGKSALAYLFLGLAVLSPLTILAAIVSLVMTRGVRRKWLWIVGCLLAGGPFRHRLVDRRDHHRPPLCAAVRRLRPAARPAGRLAGRLRRACRRHRLAGPAQAAHRRRPRHALKRRHRPTSGMTSSILSLYCRSAAVDDIFMNVTRTKFQVVAPEIDITEEDRAMSLNYDIEIEVSGKEHQGKTTLIAYLAKMLAESGAELVVQRADPQIEEKLSLDVATLKGKLVGKRIFLREIQTAI